MVAENHGQRTPVLLPVVRPVKSVDAHAAPQGSVEHSAIGGRPAIAKLGGDAEGFVGDRALRRPQPGRRGAEGLRGELARHFELLARIARIAETRRQGHPGMGNAGDRGIAHQRKNRVIVWRGRDFDLARRRQLAVLGRHLGHDLALLGSHARLVGGREVAPAAQPLAHFLVVRLKFLVEPRQLRPHLQVAKILRPEHRPRPRILLRLPGVVQLAVARVAVNHAARIGIERVAQQKSAVPIRQRFGRLQRRVEKGIAGRARGVFGNLHHHRRHQVKGLADARKLLQNAHHAVVVLERVHARPWQLVFARGQVLIKRLVHVPEEAQIDLRHVKSPQEEPCADAAHEPRATARGQGPAISRKSSAPAAEDCRDGWPATARRSIRRRRSYRPRRNPYESTPPPLVRWPGSCR